jgi:hypothetical protein
MKSQYYSLLLFLFFPICSVFAQTNNDAYQYLETIGNQFYEISESNMSYTSAVSHGKSARKVEKRRIEVLAKIKEAERTVRKMSPFQGDHAFRDSVVSYLVISRIVLNEDYGKILDMEEIAEQSYDAMEAYLLAKEKASEKLDAAYEKVKEQQIQFASRYNIKIIEGNSKLGRKIETSAKVFNYHDKIYLLFFKSYKNEAYLAEAINRNDINAIEQTKNALLNSAEQDLSKIGPLPAFKGDATLKTACQQLLNFYKWEASNYIPELITFQLKKENYEKMKAAMDAKRPADRTKDDVSAYNKAVNDFNASVSKINAQQNELNKKGADALNKWNKASEEFLDKHIPKHN